MVEEGALPPPDLEINHPGKVWIVLEGEEAPPNTITTLTRYPHIKLAWRLEVDNARQERESWTGELSADEDAGADVTYH